MFGKPLFRFKLNYGALEFANKNNITTEHEVHRHSGLDDKLKVVWKNKSGNYQSVTYRSSVVSENLNNGYWDKL